MNLPALDSDITAAPPTPHAPPSAATSPQNPWSVAVVSEKIRSWIARLGDVWVEGQIVQFRERPGAWMQYMVLRDVDEQVSLNVSVMSNVVKASTATVQIGSRVVVHVKPDFYKGNGSFTMRATEIRPVGIGELLARIEHLRQVLAAEGLFDADRKKPLPFLPRLIGLVTGRNSDAEHDVIKNAQARWPGARFEVREVAVQGTYAVRAVTEAITELDEMPEVDVIVVTRGGGAFEDLLPFSDESLVRVVAACRTPLVSAIGHEQDNPLIDYAADVRASTPTDAAKRVVPDVARERLGLDQARRGMRTSLKARIEREQGGLASVLSRPVMARPETMIDHREMEIAHTIDSCRHMMNEALLGASISVGRLSAQVRTLSPAATLERGYAVVRTEAGAVVRARDEAPAGTRLAIRFANDEVMATVTR
jgi:exodeoxyribonuclease VII large subunit